MNTEKALFIPPSNSTTLQFLFPYLGRSYMFTGALSGGLQQNRDMFNWSNSALQMGPQTQLNISSGKIMNGTTNC
jgi:hypothetical protein